MKTKRELSLDDVAVLKGLFALMVLLHHLSQNITLLHGTILQDIFGTLGYLSVSAFLFLSGYGLSISHERKGAEYIKAFPKKKILPLYIYNLILIAIYLIFWFVLGETLSARRIYLSFSFGHTVIKYGWYIQATLFLYLIFYIAYRIKNKIGTKFIFLFGYAFYFYLCYINDAWSMWYISVFAFGVGIIYAHLRNRVNLNVFLWGALFLAAYIPGTFLVKEEVPIILLKMCVSIIFPLLVVALKQHITANPMVFKKMSKISFEIYVSQGLFITLFHSKFINIQNELLYLCVVILSTVLFAFVLNKVFSKIKF